MPCDAKARAPVALGLAGFFRERRWHAGKATGPGGETDGEDRDKKGSTHCPRVSLGSDGLDRLWSFRLGLGMLAFSVVVIVSYRWLVKSIVAGNYSGHRRAGLILWR